MSWATSRAEKALHCSTIYTAASYGLTTSRHVAGLKPAATVWGPSAKGCIVCKKRTLARFASVIGAGSTALTPPSDRVDNKSLYLIPQPDGARGIRTFSGPTVVAIFFQASRTVDFWQRHSRDPDSASNGRYRAKLDARSGLRLSRQSSGELSTDQSSAQGPQDPEL